MAEIPLSPSRGAGPPGRPATVRPVGGRGARRPRPSVRRLRLPRAPQRALDDPHDGFSVIPALVFALITAAHVLLELNAVLAFWPASVTTRPLGASIDDRLSQTKHDGGLGLGTTGTSGIFLAVILILVTFLTVAERDVIEQGHS